MPHYVFISYSNKNKVVADAVCAKLEENKIRVWVAPRDVPPGKDYAESIIDAIDGCKAFVLIWSEESNKSGHILNEINRAFNQSITVIPFRIDNIVPTKSLEYYIGRTHWLDAITPPLEQHIDKLVDTILETSGRTKKAQPRISEEDLEQEEKFEPEGLEEKPAEKKAHKETKEVTEKVQAKAKPNKEIIGFMLGGMIIIVAIIGLLFVNRQGGESSKTINTTSIKQSPSSKSSSPLLFDDFSSGIDYKTKWEGPYGEPYFQYEIINEVLFLRGGSGNYEFHAMPTYCEIKSCGYTKAKLLVLEEGSNGWGQAKIQYYVDLSDGTWFTQCNLGGDLDGNQVAYFCEIVRPNGTLEYSTDPIYVNFDTWVTAAIKIDPATAYVHFYLNDELMNEYLPADSDRLKEAEYVSSIGVWTDENSYISAYIDDVWVSNP